MTMHGTTSRILLSTISKSNHKQQLSSRLILRRPLVLSLTTNHHHHHHHPVVSTVLSIPITTTLLNNNNNNNNTNIPHRFFSSKTATTTTTRRSSNRQSFKEIPIDDSIRSYLDDIGVGIPSRKKRHFKKNNITLANRSRRRNNKRGNDNETDGLLYNERDEAEFLSRREAQANSVRRFRKDVVVGSQSPRRRRNRPVKIIGQVSSMEDEFPRSSRGLPEIAIVGRSNVGKSTLLNALLYGHHIPPTQKKGRHAYLEQTKLPRGAKALTSPLPGTTRSLTFYQFHPDNNSSGLLLVDLPGYGFARASYGEMDKWRECMMTYLSGKRREGLKRVLWLLDARHGFKVGDWEFLKDWVTRLKIDAAAAAENHNSDDDDNITTTTDVAISSKRRQQQQQQIKKQADLPPIQLILTKCDLVSRDDLARRAVLIKRELLDHLTREPRLLPVMFVSAKPGAGFDRRRGGGGGDGIKELQKELASFVRG